jgi:hypothetical protein
MIFEVSSVHEQMQLQRILFIKLRNDNGLNLSENDDDTTILERNSPEKNENDARQRNELSLFLLYHMAKLFHNYFV